MLILGGETGVNTTLLNVHVGRALLHELFIIYLLCTCTGMHVEDRSPSGVVSQSSHLPCILKQDLFCVGLSSPLWKADCPAKPKSAYFHLPSHHHQDYKHVLPLLDLCMCAGVELRFSCYVASTLGTEVSPHAVWHYSCSEDFPLQIENQRRIKPWISLTLSCTGMAYRNVGEGLLVGKKWLTDNRIPKPT